MSVGITGAKVWPNEDTAKEFTEGLIKGLRRSTNVVLGGQKQGIDLWAETAARTRGMRMSVLPPLRIKGKPYHMLSYNERNKKFITASSVIFAIVPDTYDWTKGETKRLVEEARIAKRHHIIVHLQEDGTPREITEVKAEELLHDVPSNGGHDSGDVPASKTDDVPVPEPRHIAVKKTVARSSPRTQRSGASRGGKRKIQVRPSSARKSGKDTRSRRILVVTASREGTRKTPAHKPDRLKVKLKEKAKES